ncbi:putative endonuclease 4 [Koleobacter methoxysyntrophicus]|uniref:Probable endonuclease 4 n=1 Tax=Koleobacter methoxysyntrophicus TaxID=2751313 RepID=A0A8A0RJ81_9FIRM|nr:deoxyribonuclease IV [Koleobacter methoxysyntrophicus]QSQ07700.1 putative endonuclease 4 [Koleobacter methoxysyntrophicus]
MYIGAHISISKGYEKAVKQAVEIGCNTMQFFTRNPRGSKAKALDADDLARADEYRKETSFGPMVAHAPYTLNLASFKEDTWDFAKMVMKEDLKRLEAIGASYMVVHPGSHLGYGLEYGIQRIADALNEIITGSERVMILLEGMAGVGTEIGYTFEQLEEIIARVDKQENLGVCFDTCHLYCAGYDVKDDLNTVLEELDKVIGIYRLKAFHLNDSKNPLGSRKDRHENIGEGELGIETFENIINHPELKDIPFLLETPGGIDVFEKEIRLLRTLVKEKI